MITYSWISGIMHSRLGRSKIACIISGRLGRFIKDKRNLQQVEILTMGIMYAIYAGQWPFT